MEDTTITADIDLLNQEIERERNLLNTDRLDMSFGEIMSMYERKEIIIRPAFQRYFRWDDTQKTRFIESILLGIPIPPIFVAEDGEGIWELVDGLQRISTILSFFGLLRSDDEGLRSKNNWSMLEGDRVPSLAGFSNETIPNKYRLNIKRATCRVEIIRWNSNYDMRFELFNRLNTGGSHLTQQEIRNAIYRDVSPTFNDFLKSLSEIPEFLDILSLDIEKLERLDHEELVLRFFSLYGKGDSLKKSNLSITQQMTKFMESAIQDDSFDYVTSKDTFLRLVKVLHKLGKGLFKQPDGNFSTALYDTIMIGISKNISFYEDASPDFILRKIEEVKTDGVMLKFSRKGGNNQASRIYNRLKEANRIFSIPTA